MVFNDYVAGRTAVVTVYPEGDSAGFLAIADRCLSGVSIGSCQGIFGVVTVAVDLDQRDAPRPANVAVDRVFCVPVFKVHVPIQKHGAVNRSDLVGCIAGRLVNGISFQHDVRRVVDAGFPQGQIGAPLYCNRARVGGAVSSHEGISTGGQIFAFGNHQIVGGDGLAAHHGSSASLGQGAGTRDGIAVIKAGCHFYGGIAVEGNRSVNVRINNVQSACAAMARATDGEGVFRGIAVTGKAKADGRAVLHHCARSRAAESLFLGDFKCARRNRRYDVVGVDPGKGQRARSLFCERVVCGVAARDHSGDVQVVVGPEVKNLGL